MPKPLGILFVERALSQAPLDVVLVNMIPMIILWLFFFLAFAPIIASSIYLFPPLALITIISFSVCVLFLEGVFPPVKLLTKIVLYPLAIVLYPLLAMHTLLIGPTVWLYGELKDMLRLTGYMIDKLEDIFRLIFLSGVISPQMVIVLVVGFAGSLTILTSLVVSLFHPSGPVVFISLEARAHAWSLLKHVFLISFWCGLLHIVLILLSPMVHDITYVLRNDLPPADEETVTAE